MTDSRNKIFNGLFSLRTENTKPNLEVTKENTGIGLKNMKRRLELMFEDNYTLKINNTDESYTAVLEFNPEKFNKK